MTPWYVIPSLEMFDRRSDYISPTLHSVAQDVTAAPRYVKYVLGRIYVFLTLFGYQVRGGG